MWENCISTNISCAFFFDICSSFGAQQALPAILRFDHRSFYLWLRFLRQVDLVQVFTNTSIGFGHFYYGSFENGFTFPIFLFCCLSSNCHHVLCQECCCPFSLYWKSLPNMFQPYNIIVLKMIYPLAWNAESLCYLCVNIFSANNKYLLRKLSSIFLPTGKSGIISSFTFSFCSFQVVGLIYFSWVPFCIPRFLRRW